MPDKNTSLSFVRKFYPVSPHYEGEKIFTRLDGRRAITPLLVVLLVIESTDVLFAVDSIPAVFGITQDDFLVFTSNIFAILGWPASRFFAVTGLMGKFRYIKFSLVSILVFIGVKMVLSDELPIADEVALGVIVAFLAIGVASSLLIPASPVPRVFERARVRAPGARNRISEPSVKLPSCVPLIITSTARPAAENPPPRGGWLNGWGSSSSTPGRCTAASPRFVSIAPRTPRPIRRRWSPSPASPRYGSIGPPIRRGSTPDRAT